MHCAKPQTTRVSRLEWLSSRPALYFLLFTAAFLYLHLFSLPATPILWPGDQWLFSASGARVLRGELPYRDFFEMLAPGIDVFYCGLFRLFGESIAAVNAAGLVLGLLLTALAVYVSGALLPGWQRFVPALMVAVFAFRCSIDITHHWFSAIAVYGSIAVLTPGATRFRLAVAGGLCATASFFTQSRGLAALFALAVYVLWARRRSDEGRAGMFRDQAALLGAFLVVLVAEFGYFLVHVGPRTLFESIVSFPSAYYGAYNRVMDAIIFPRLSVQTLRAFLVLLIHRAFPLLVYLAFGVFWFVRPRTVRAQPAVVLVFLVGAALLVEVLNHANQLRLAAVMLPACVLGGWMLDEWGVPGRRVLAAAAAMLVLGGVVDSAVVQLHRVRRLDLPTGRVVCGNNLLCDEVVEIGSRTRPGQWLFGDMEASFPLGLRNPARIPFLSTTEFTRPEQVAEVIDALERHRVCCVIFTHEDDQPEPPVADHLGPFREYMRAHYVRHSGAFWERVR